MTFSYLEITFFIFTGIQLFYHLFFFLRPGIARNKATKPESESLDKRKEVSIVVCAHYELENLKRLLPELLHQDYSQFEVIVIDDRTEDESYDYLMDIKAKHTHFKLVRVDEVPDHVNGKKYGITLGIKAAKYEWILLCDADCVPVGKNWVAQMAAAMDEEKEIVLGYSPVEPKKGFLNAFIRYENIQTALQYLGFALARVPYMGVGRNLAYRKALFLDNKGFNQHLKVNGGDDDLFINQHAKAKNTAVQIHPEAIVYTKGKESWGELVAQKKRHYRVGLKYKQGHKILLGLNTLSWLGFWGLFILTIFTSSQLYLLLGVWLIREVFQILSIALLCRRCKTRFPWALAPLFEVVYLIFYPWVSLKSAFTRKIKWN